MAKRECVGLLKRSISAWNDWRIQNPDVIPNLRNAKLSHLVLKGANLKGADLSGAEIIHSNLNEADLQEANLEHAWLWHSTFIKTNLKRAKLYQADLRGVNLGGADLSEADLCGAGLVGADLAKAKLNNANLNINYRMNPHDRELGAEFGQAKLIETELRGVDFTLVTIAYTTFGNVDLSECTNLENVFHLGPSVIDFATIKASKDLPIKFLRGCGLSELDIEYTKLANSGLDPDQVTDITYRIHELYLRGGIQYYSCFISYNSRDEEFARQLHDDLQNNGVRCWFDREDLKIGDPIRPTIDQQIRQRDKLLVILSENSVKSEWVGDEVEAALEEENKSKRLVLLPVRLDDAVMNSQDDWAAKIKRRRHIGDFSNWKDKSSYQKAFERLLRDLKATGDSSMMEGE